MQGCVHTKRSKGVQLVIMICNLVLGLGKTGGNLSSPSSSFHAPLPFSDLSKNARSVVSVATSNETSPGFHLAGGLGTKPDTRLQGLTGTVQITSSCIDTDPKCEDVGTPYDIRH